MPLYNPPSSTSVDFDLKPYALASGNDVDFDLTGVAETKTSQFYFDWNLLKTITSQYYLEWWLQKLQKSSFTLKTNLYKYRYLCNCLPYFLLLRTPVITEKKYKITTTGCLRSVYIKYLNTGTSGSTIIKIYHNENIIFEKEIQANNSEFTKTYIIDSLPLLSTDELLKIKVEQVASDSSYLLVRLEQITFNEELKIVEIGNEWNGIYFRSIDKKTLFKEADYWIIYFNQPIIIDAVIGILSTGEEIDLSYSLEDSYIKNNKLKITKTSQSISSIYISVRDLNYKSFNFHLEDINFEDKIVDFPTYVYKDRTIKRLIDAYGWYYQIDNVYRSEITTSPYITLKNTLKDGKWYQIKFVFITEYDKQLEKAYQVFLASDVMNASIGKSGNSLLIKYNDECPLVSVKIFKNNEQILHEKNFISCEGFDLTVQDLGNAVCRLNLSQGVIRTNDNNFKFDNQYFDINMENDTQKSIYIVFNRDIQQIETLIPDKYYPYFPQNSPIDTSLYYPLWYVSLHTGLEEDHTLSVISTTYDLRKDYYEISLPEKEDIFVRLEDEAGRTLNITPDFADYQDLELDSFYVIEVYDSNNNRIESGDIHSSSILHIVFKEVTNE